MTNIDPDLWPLIVIAVIIVVTIGSAHIHAIWSRGQAPGRRVGKWPEDAPPLSEVVQGVIRKNSLQACLLQPNRELPITNHATTIIGDVRCCNMGEVWPTRDGVPMVGICQINLLESPYVPEVLSDLAFIAVFMARDKKDKSSLDFPIRRQENRDKWVVRTYQSTEGLVPYADAPPPVFHPCAVEHRILQDPAPDHGADALEVLGQLGLGSELVEWVEEEIGESLGDLGWGTKLGGWPAPIQNPIERPLAFQLGSEGAADMDWIDGGCVYFWRTKLEDGRDEWTMDLQFH